MSCGKNGCGGPCGGPCKDRPDDIRCPRMCLYSFSKNVEGDIRLLDREIERCDDLQCQTLKLIDFVRARALSNELCDSEQGRLFDGELKLYDLTHALMDGESKRRGFHGANFRLNGRGGIIDGTLSGITNANTHRLPYFEGQEKDQCDVPGLMEGRFCGTVQVSRAEQLLGAQVIGTYRFRVDEGFEPELTRIFGTLEGVIVASCGT